MSTSAGIFAKIAVGLANAAEHVLSNVKDSQERDFELRNLISKYAPCPVEGCQWSLVNSIDYNFEGFSSERLTSYAKTNSVKKLAKISLTPDLYVTRDLCLAAKLAYEDPKVINYFCKKWNMNTDEFLNFTFKDTQAFIMHDQNNIVLSFRGTELVNAKDWATDFQLGLVPFVSNVVDGASASSARKRANPLAHKGFLDALGLASGVEIHSPFIKIYDSLMALLNQSQRMVWVTGHSLGAALASIFLAKLIIDDDPLLLSLGGVYTYGQPRCGDAEYCKLFNDTEKGGFIFRVVNKSDLVTKVPMKTIGYAHHGNKFDLEKSGSSVVGVVTTTKIGPVTIRGTKKPDNNAPESSTLKKILFALLPHFLEDHYPCEYIKNIEALISSTKG